MDIPSTDVIRHWCGWGADEDFSAIRVLQFEAWLAEVKAEAWAEGAVAVHMYFDYRPNSTIPRNPYAVKGEEQ